MSPSDEILLSYSRLMTGTANIQPETNRLLNQAMLMLAAQPGAIFIGQNVEYDGNVMYKHLEGVPMNKRLEFPVAEELQLGVSTGLALQGFLPISIYPRIDFLILAMNQLVNHLDKLEQMSQGQFKPHVIIRTKIGSKWPLDAGPQHTQNHAFALSEMLKNTHVSIIDEPGKILWMYELAAKYGGAHLMIEALD